MYTIWSGSPFMSVDSIRPVSGSHNILDCPVFISYIPDKEVMRRRLSVQSHWLVLSHQMLRSATGSISSRKTMLLLLLLLLLLAVFH